MCGELVLPVRNVSVSILISHHTDQRHNLVCVKYYSKRAKMQNGAGASAATEIYDENLGVMHKVDKMTAVVHEDFEYTQKFNEIYNRDRIRKSEAGDLTDGQIYITERLSWTPQWARDRINHSLRKGGVRGR